jgi:hypothetical protein
VIAITPRILRQIVLVLKMSRIEFCRFSNICMHPCDVLGSKTCDHLFFDHGLKSFFDTSGDLCERAGVAGFTKEVAYVSGPLDARGGAWGGAPQAFSFGPQACFLLFFTCYEIRNLRKYLVIQGLFYTFLFLLLY